MASRTEPSANIERAFVAGLPIVRAGLSEAADLVLADAASGRPRVYVLVNAHSSKLRRDSADYARMLADTDACVGLPDGVSVTIAARLLGRGNIGRSPGPDLIETVCSRAAKTGTPVFLLGGSEGVADQLAAGLIERHPGLEVAGTATPPFGEWPTSESEALVESVKSSGARVLWMGVSAPKQEIWAYEHALALGMPSVCVGAAFDFNTMQKVRAPRWMRRYGLEWVHRLATEPRRMWKRYLFGNAMFVGDVLRFGRRPANRP